MAACPCGSGATLADCCGQLLDGGAADTAEALMRSRYTAFVGRRSDYLLATWAPEKRPSALDLSRDRTEWLGLQIVAVVAGGPDDAVGEVEFIARYRNPAGAGAQRERSRFRREAGRWLYVDGQVAAVPQPGEATARSGAGVGRNDPCPCGSGSKWKRCCGR